MRVYKCAPRMCVQFQATFQTLSCSHTERQREKLAVGMEIILNIPKQPGRIKQLQQTATEGG